MPFKNIELNKKEMLTAIILGLLAAALLGALIVWNLLKSRGETADAVRWANRQAPLIFEQPAAGEEWQEETITQYERALNLLETYGNKLLSRDKDVFLWIHRADVKNSNLDFEAWQNENAVRRVKIFEDFYLEKARQAAKKNELINLAKLKTTDRQPSENSDFERSENGQY